MERRVKVSLEAEPRNSRLCKACSTIFSGERIGTSDEDDIEYDHHETLADLREAVVQKCPLCRRLFELMSKKTEDWEKVGEHLEPSESATSITLSPNSRSLTVHAHLNLTRPSKRFVDAIVNLYPWNGRCNKARRIVVHRQPWN
jgi:hypothetical protein